MATLDGFRYAARHATRGFRVGALALLAGLATCIVPVAYGTTSTRTAASTAQTAPRTLAVLPFTMPNNPVNDGWFTTGFSRELIRTLGHNPHLRVTAWRSAQHFQDSSEPPAAIGKALGVQALLRGTLASSGQQLVMFVKLTDAHTGATLWSGSFSAATPDLGNAETQIAQRTAHALHVPSAPPATVKPPTAKAHLLALYAQATLWNANSPQAVAAARHYAEQAVALDAHYAEAHALVAQAWMAIVSNMPGTMQEAAALPEVSVAARKALAIDPDNVDALYALASADSANNRLNAAKPLYQRALKVDPSYASVWYALGDMAHSLVAARKDFATAVRLDPFNFAAQNNLADMYLDLGEYRQALPAAVAYRTQQPNDVGAAFLLALNETLLDQPQAAITAFDIVRPPQAFDRQLDAAGKLAYEVRVHPALRVKAVAAVKALGDWSSLNPEALESVMQAELALGERAQVLAQLPHLCGESPVSCVDLGSFPLWNPLHGGRRFAELVKRFNTMSTGGKVASRAQ
ncbi:MAG TPA: tetratricopeptide repeat protein [Rhodanobacteraceae bacterium]